MSLDKEAATIHRKPSILCIQQIQGARKKKGTEKEGYLSQGISS